MKTTIFKTAPILLIGFIIVAFISKEKKDDFVKIGWDVYTSKYELTNKEYREFLKYLENSNLTEKLQKCIYDSTKWKINRYSYMEPYVELYHWHPAYDNYPIVNVTKESAELYCEWLTVKYNSNVKRKYKKVLFRLPTEKEWKALSNPLPDHVLPWYGSYPYNPNGTFMANTKCKLYGRGGDDYSIDGSFILGAVGTYEPNGLGIYDAIGNVAEMTSDNVILGGSWDNYIDECGVDKNQDFDIPDPRVGIRIVMKVVEE